MAVFSEDLAVARHFVTIPALPPSHPAGMLVVLTTPVKLSKMAGYSASYSFNSWCTGIEYK